MFCLSKPGRVEIDRFISAAADSCLSYQNIGATRDLELPLNGAAPITSHVIDHNRELIGTGENDWEKSKEAIRNWKMFDFQWVELCWPDTPIESGKNVAILVGHLGFFSLNAARIVYTLDEPNRFGFAYGTLEDHSESGEERFSVEFDAESGDVWYDLLAFSRPNHFLAWLGYPFTRALQKQFALDSKAAIKRVVTRGNDVKL
ncbi:MAG TPA: DUF1990 domain-containing protein [Pyrinomonadaceae bacterium]|nr:DUF1990 domain-containing protein [Pyrinomonadaceae bacterium]